MRWRPKAEAAKPARQGATPSGPRRARDSLSREIIVAAADAVVERDGLDRLTFQSIGEELDAHPTSIYRHFRDKDELLLALIDTLRAPFVQRRDGRRPTTGWPTCARRRI